MSEEQAHSFDEARRDRIAAQMERVLDRVAATNLEAQSIAKLAQLVAPGAQFIDITVRKDGREYRFEGDWIARLFRTPPEAKPDP